MDGQGIRVLGRDLIDALAGFSRVAIGSVREARARHAKAYERPKNSNF